MEKDERAKWIDLWVICDEARAYPFYTRSHSDVYVRTTRIEDFPRGWSAGKKAFSGVHEAVHIYKVRGRAAYHMIYEVNREGRRSFGLAVVEHLSGAWSRVTDEYATGAQLGYADGQPAWTGEVSHGEVIRSGYDQRLAYEPEGCRWLIQGLAEAEHQRPYESLPWKLGTIHSVKR